MAKRSRILRAVGCEPHSVLRAHTPDQSVPAPCEADPESNKANPGLREFNGEIHRNETGRPVSAVFTEAVERVCSVTGADGAVIALIDQWGVICRVSSGTAPAIGSYRQPYSGLTTGCLETGQVVICEDAESDFRACAAVARSLQSHWPKIRKREHLAGAYVHFADTE